MKLGTMVVLALFAFGFTGSAMGGELTARDRALLQQHAIQDAELTAKFAQAEKSLPSPTLDLPFLSDRAKQDGCIDSCIATCQGGAGSAACWSQCTVEGYGSQVCAGRCGVTTSAGSQACWNKCTVEGYSSSVCAPRCGIATGAGSQACWNKCSVEGYSSSVCAPRCGITTAEGMDSCWKRCKVEGYSSSVCATRCGTG